VDANNQVVAHPDPTFSAELRDLSAYAPIVALRQGARGLMTFTDDQERRWRAYVDEMDNGWGVVVQQPEAEALTSLRHFQRISWTVMALGAALLLALTWLTTRQAFRPIGALTDTAAAIAAGDLTRNAPVESEDEFGLLARAFNRMTEQLRGLISGLEQHVLERTTDLERRSNYLEAAAEVSRAATSILEPDQLMGQVVELIRERFDLYYVGLFLVDEAHEWVVLRTGTGEAGRAMLARGHRIRVGEGMVGWSVANSQARVALEAGADAIRLATVELPETRSEAAIPLRSRGQVLGALTVQDSRPGAFDRDAIAAFQAMADQVAVALDNARLFAENQAALDTTRRAYGQLSHQAWTELLRARMDWGYRYTQNSVIPITNDWQPETLQAVQTGQMAQSGHQMAQSGHQSVQRSPASLGEPGLGGNGTEVATLAVPLKVRDQVIGALSFRRGESDQAWAAEEIALLETLAEQLAMALESARLYQDIQRRAERERLTAQVTTRMRETLDMETVLKTAVQEVRQALGLSEVVVRLVPQVSTQADNGGE
jgi:GAF domain-containing protein/HAMP domain-containing protein